MGSLNLAVVSAPNLPYLALLSKLPKNVTVTVGSTEEELRDAFSKADVLLNGLGGGSLFRAMFPQAQAVRWVHSLAAGVEGVLSPELLKSPVPLTNARGVFAETLGEFVVAAALFFAKDLRRMVRSQAAGKWDQFDVEVLFQQSMAIVGYGAIGRSAAKRAKALGMKVFATRRRPELLDGDPLVDKGFAVEQRAEMMAQADYVVATAPLTPATHGLIGEKEIAAMKTSAVIMNVGRGPVIDEKALITALQENRIRGAALDVFDKEPLAADHPFWRLENVLLSPHCADHTPGWMEDAMEFFLENFQRFANGEPLKNIVDKEAGY